jgi:hypothetical protein
VDRALGIDDTGAAWALAAIAAGATGSAVAIEAGKHFERRDPAGGRFAREEASDAQPVTTTS